MLRTILVGKTVEQSLSLGLSHCFPSTFLSTYQKELLHRLTTGSISGIYLIPN